MKAFGQSWERTSGNDFPIIIAVLVLVMIPTAISIAAGLMFEKGALTGILVGQTAQSLASLLGLSMGVALYGMIIGVPQGEASAE
jgi:hypothetical protein